MINRNLFFCYTPSITVLNFEKLQNSTEGSQVSFNEFPPMFWYIVLCYFTQPQYLVKTCEIGIDTVLLTEIQAFFRIRQFYMCSLIR